MISIILMFVFGYQYIFGYGGKTGDQIAILFLLAVVEIIIEFILAVIFIGGKK